jgi:two-component system sensor histidine kinase KdpD
LIEAAEPFAKQLTHKLAEIFGLSAVVLYDRRADEVYRAGPLDFEGMDEQLREAALQGTSFADPKRNRVITAVRLGSEPIAGLAVQGNTMPDSVMQGIANLVAIGLERARAQDFAHQVEAARQTEQLRTALIDAMAHEFKTPLTSIKAATTALLSNPDQPADSREELLKIADEEAQRLKELIDNAIEVARLEAEEIGIQSEPSDLGELVRSVVASMQTAIDRRPLEVAGDPNIPKVVVDRRLIALAIKQLVDNALKYSPPGTPIAIRVTSTDGRATLEITNRGTEISPQEQRRIFDRFYRSPSVHKRIPGSGLGLSIARRIAQAHGGDLAVTSRAGETTFRMRFPVQNEGAGKGERR